MYCPRVIPLQEEEDEAGIGRSFSAGYVFFLRPSSPIHLLLRSPPLTEMYCPSLFEADDRSHDGSEGLGVLMISVLEFVK